MPAEVKQVSLEIHSFSSSFRFSLLLIAWVYLFLNYLSISLLFSGRVLVVLDVKLSLKIPFFHSAFLILQFDVEYQHVVSWILFWTHAAYCQDSVCIFPEVIQIQLCSAVNNIPIM